MILKVISLARSHARREAFAKHNAHLPYEFVDAVEGRSLSAQDLAQSGAFADGLDYTPGAYGCALSHLALWDRCIALDQPLTIVEDDAVFRHDFERQYADALARLPADWDFVLWGWNLDFVLSLRFMPGVSPAIVRFDQAQMRGAIPQFQALSDPPQMLRLDKVWGIPAYTLSPAGARRFRADCFPLRPLEYSLPLTGQRFGNTGVDSPMNLVYPRTQSFVAFPPLVVTPNDHAVSTIQTPLARKGVLSRTARRLKAALRG